MCDSGCKTIRTQRNLEFSLSRCLENWYERKKLFFLYILLGRIMLWLDSFAPSACWLAAPCFGVSQRWHRAQTELLRHGEITKSTFSRHASTHWLLCSLSFFSHRDGWSVNRIIILSHSLHHHRTEASDHFLFANRVKDERKQCLQDNYVSI